jgi:hypothetical protein
MKDAPRRPEDPLVRGDRKYRLVECASFQAAGSRYFFLMYTLGADEKKVLLLSDKGICEEDIGFAYAQLFELNGRVFLECRYGNPDGGGTHLIVRDVTDLSKAVVVFYSNSYSSC